MTQKMRRHLIKCGTFCTLAVDSEYNNCRALPLVFTALGLRTVHKSSENHKNPALNKPNVAPSYGLLFNEIVSILGTETVAIDSEDRPLGSLASKPVKLLQGVCENAEEKEGFVDTSYGLLASPANGGIEVKDVSAIVHKVTEIVRGENSGPLSMEERLKNADFELNEEVVEMVLKRCFKVPHLSLRFFNWTKMAKGFQHTTRTYEAMIDIAGEAKDLRLMENLADEMMGSSCEKSVKTWTILASHYGKAKMLGKALLMFEGMKKQGIKPDAIAYRKMLRALCDARKADIALEFYKEMVRKNVEVDLGLYKQLIKCLASHGNTDSVRLVAGDMARVFDSSESCVYGVMMKSFCISGRIREALELVREMGRKSLSLDVEIFETLVRGLCDNESIDDALEIVEIMKKRNVCGPKVFDILIKAHLRRNELSEAFNLFRGCENSGNASISAYTMLLQRLFRENEFQKGIELYEEMLEKEVPLDSLAITAVAMGFLRQNRVPEAWDLFKSMDERGIKPNSKACAVFLKELCKYCGRDEIIGFLDELKARKVDIRDRTFKEVLSYLEKKGGETEKLNAISRLQGDLRYEPISEGGPYIDKHDDNLKMIGESGENQIGEHGSLREETNQHILEVRRILSSSSNFCPVQEKLEKCTFNFTPHLVEEVLRDCARYIGAALNFFSWIRKNYANTLNEKLYNLAIKIAGKGKNFREMRSIFHEMRRRGFPIIPDTWTIMIMQYGKTGLTDKALSCFREMKLSGCRPNSSTYHCLIASLCGKKGRKVEEAVKLYQEMCGARFSPDKGLIESYVGCLCEVGRFSDARICIESLSEFGFSTPLRYSLYIRALHRAGKWELAQSLMDEIGGDDDERNQLYKFTYGSLIHSLLHRGRVQEAFAKIESMRSLGIHPTVHVYTDLIVHFLKEKQLEKALETLQEMKEKGCEPTVVTYSALMCGYVRLGLVTDAWDIFRGLKRNGPLPDFKTYSMFIDSLCRAGESEEAFGVLSEMVLDGVVPSAVNFRNVVYGLNREGNPRLAEVVRKKKIHLRRRRRTLRQW